MGELHGTDAVPYWFGELACHASRSSSQVLVGLEIPATQQQRIDTFLRSNGGGAARAALTRGQFWEGHQDGRASVAMVELLDRLRRLRREGANVDLVAFDGDYRDGAERERGMAETFSSAIEAHAGWSWVALAGNVHARPVPGVPGDPNFSTMAMHLERLGIPVTALNLRHGGGRAWVCPANGPCGPTEFEGETDADPRVELLPTRNSFDGFLFVGPIEASPPAKHALAEMWARR